MLGLSLVLATTIVALIHLSITELALPLFDQFLAIGFAFVMPHLSGMSKSCPVIISYGPGGGPRNGSNRRAHTPQRTIYDGFGDRAIQVILIGGIAIVFCLPFLGLITISAPSCIPIAMTLHGHPFLGAETVNLDDWRSEASGHMKRLRTKGPLFEPGPGPCQGRNCLRCLSEAQCSVSKLLRKLTVPC